MKYFWFSVLIVALLIPFFAGGQITTDPKIPVAGEKVTITFDSSKETRLGYFTGDLYAHTGVGIEGKGDWQNVVGGANSWGKNDVQPKLTNKGDGIYELEIAPDINTFYSVGDAEKVINMSFVFRSADATEQTSNLSVTVYQEGLVVEITEPVSNSIFMKNQSVSISAHASAEADLKLYLNETVLAQTTGQTITTTHSFSESGNYLLIAEAGANDEIQRDSVSVFVREEAVEATLPENCRKGINYPTDTSATLVLFAPYKEFVFVTGDFNNWELQNEYQMKKDGDYFWLEIPDLEKGKEYAFQYLIDGEIRVADPYSEKILDPWNDQYINSETYPGLISYPENKAEGIVSVLHPGQDEYQWQVADFQVPEKQKLVIYELLIRDFTEQHTFKAVREKLDYLEDLNINVLELMPVNEFEGNSSWGYNPSFYFAPDKYYGPKNELKKLVDECHKRGIAVVIDMVLNHSYGQSPFVQMYMDNWTVTEENPWYNVESNFANENLRWGYDFNHEADAVKELVDSINSFWMTEYKVDGFRFDFTKGFSNTPFPSSSWGSEYDAARIANLKRMAGEIWNRKHDALVIFEHLSDNPEEKELADFGILLWGIMHDSYRDAGRGNTGASDLSWGVYDSRNWDEPNLVTYAESHDEERIMVDLLKSGFIEGDYNVRQLPTALNRMELNSVFMLPLPGPKMIWQFGERGYDVSINDFGGRLSEKPSRWEYLGDENRTDLFRVMAQLNYLKQTYEEFSPENFEYNLNGQLRWYRLTSNGNHVFAVGNFGIQATTATITFPETGEWFEFFSQTSVDVENATQNLALQPGEYKLYSTRKLLKTDVITDTEEVKLGQKHLKIFPNPANSEVTIVSEKPFSQFEIYSLTGKLVQQVNVANKNRVKIAVDNFTPGVYFIHAFQNDTRITEKLIVF
ncbi:Por secretion system C-terminal sorting domain-containing protein [Mariniphaga anaerophila]|uniref:Por secretion system C-terminal sorting domain-containing protein n=1 Tax=Mariniphaga anaerophila TaxID=1484053 RepID=A0A1M5BQP7_9BACT|nr:alpha-amylase family glycosyl hydrolase [Mariniphaga anaerophila]SHF44592.1 Por secretion system C-terminal sorting domain-containing protein [Mariniphaga anaerophila]